MMKKINSIFRLFIYWILTRRGPEGLPGKLDPRGPEVLGVLALTEASGFDVAFAVQRETQAAESSPRPACRER